MSSLSKNVFNVKSDTRLLNYRGGPIINSYEAEAVWWREYRDDGVDFETIDLNMKETYRFGQGTDAVARIRENFGITKKPFFLYAVTNEKSVFKWNKWKATHHEAYEWLRLARTNYQAQELLGVVDDNVRPVGGRDIVPLIGKWKVGIDNYQYRKIAKLFLDISRIDERKERIVVEEQKRLWEEEERLPLDAQLGIQVPQEAILLLSNTVVEEDVEELVEGVYEITIKTIEDEVEGTEQ